MLLLGAQRLPGLGLAAVVLAAMVRGSVALLPAEFKYELGLAGGAELVWSPGPPPSSEPEPTSSDKPQNVTTAAAAAPPPPPIRVGGSRPEFRLGDGVVLGYPSERRGKGTASLVLALPMTQSIRQQISELGGGESLQVWSSGRRLDAGGYAGLASGTDTSAETGGAFVSGTLPKAPTVPVHPAAKGKYKTSRLSYTLPSLPYSEFEVPMEVVAEVTHPLGIATKAPLILILHGRHATCYQGGPDGDDEIVWPCPSGFVPIPSHSGYRYVADPVASQGYIVVSVSANSINAQDRFVDDSGASARSILIRHHLGLWAQWSSAGGDPWSGIFRGKVDMSKVILVGHSRGGEGTNRAAIDAKATDPYKIVGLVSYVPTAFGRQVTPDVHAVTILSTCDGDVSNLQGQTYVDTSRDVAYSTALRSAVVVLGANHNYFNTEWTPGLAVAPADDDWFDEFDQTCGAVAGAYRITPREQQRAAAAYTAALVRLAARQDAAMLPLLDGSFVRPKALGRVDVATQAVGGAGYRLLYRPETRGSPILGRGMRGGECQGYLPDVAGPLPECNEEGFSSPHFLARNYEFTHPAPQALVLEWTTIGATARFAVPQGRRDFRSLDHINIRVANNPAVGSGAVLGIRIKDAKGRTVFLATSLASVQGWPGTRGMNRIHARTLRGSLASARSTAIDLRTITDIFLVATGESGKVWVLDISATQQKVAVPVALDLPVLSVGIVEAQEGDGPMSAMVGITASRRLPSPASVWVQNGADGFRLSLPAGSSGVVARVNVSWTGDSVYSTDSLDATSVSIGALTGAITGRYMGGVEIEEDDPTPTLSVTRSPVEIAEGDSFEWTLNLSSPASAFELSCFSIQVSNFPEVTSSDVPTQWLQLAGIDYPPTAPARLSALEASVTVPFGYGETVAVLSVPTVDDGFVEGEEAIAFLCTDDGFGIVEELIVTGIVRANGVRRHV